MGSLISVGNIWFVQALISLLFFFLMPCLTSPQHIFSKSASYCLYHLHHAVFFPPLDLNLSMQDMLGCGK